MDYCCKCPLLIILMHSSLSIHTIIICWIKWIETIPYIRKQWWQYIPLFIYFSNVYNVRLSLQVIQYPIPYSLNHDSPVFIVYIITLIVYSLHTDDNWLFAFYIYVPLNDMVVQPFKFPILLGYNFLVTYCYFAYNG